MVGGAKLAGVCAILQRRAFVPVGKGDAPKARSIAFVDGLGLAADGYAEGVLLIPSTTVRRYFAKPRLRTKGFLTTSC